MSRSYSCKLVQHHYKKQNGKSNILLQVVIKRKKVVIKTGVEIQHYLFNKNTQRIIHGGNVPKEIINDLNLILDHELAKANEVFVKARLKDTVLSAPLFKELFMKSEVLGEICFVEFMEDEIKRIENSRAKSTIVTYKRTFEKLKSFKTNIMFNELSKSLIEDFDRSMIQSGLNQNSRSLHHKNINTFINIAIDRDVDLINPYKTFKRKRIKGNREYLNIDELKKFTEAYDKKLLPEYLHTTLEYFLFSCYTGLRFSDVECANSKSINNNVFIYNPVKSINKLKTVKVPLNDRAMKIIKDRNGKIFNTKTNQITNKDLHEISDSLGINKCVTFHVARHTFATTFLTLGGKIEVLQKIMGHSKLETTMVYAHIMEEDMIDQIANFNEI